ncbi:MAG: protein-disulfide reductase DsbD domain-containing protein, partial [Bryobacteraceae bacterium]
MKLTRLILCFTLALAAASAQKLDPAQWTLDAGGAAKAAPGSTLLLRLTAHVDSNWHIYSLTNPPGGAGLPTEIYLDPNPAISGVRVFQPAPVRKRDPNFNVDAETFEGAPVFLIEATISPGAPAGPLALDAKVRYNVCNAQICLPPRRKTVLFTLAIAPGAPAATPAVPPGYVEFTGAAAPASAPIAPATQSQDLGPFLLLALAAGLASIFTPCVFPMIPITVSYFLNRQDQGRRDTIVHALIFSVGIIVLFCLLGFGVTAIAGPFGVVQLG